DFTHLPNEGDVLVSSSYPAVLDPVNRNVNETATTIGVFDGIMLIDGGAPAGAMEDAYQRLAGYNRTIVPASGKPSPQTMVMPIPVGDNGPMASSVGALLGVGGLDTWDPSFLAGPLQGMVAVIVGPDYWDRVQQAPSTTSTSSTIVTTSAP
ncbi:MAG: hypothetical protein QOC57_2181, partial [Ilumatobacteraceae bacterium]